jgi:hypothetical protein
MGCDHWWPRHHLLLLSGEPTGSTGTLSPTRPGIAQPGQLPSNTHTHTHTNTVITIDIYASHPDDVEEGGTQFWAHSVSHSITRAYHWTGKGLTADSAAQDCLNAINMSRRKVTPECALLTLDQVETTLTSYQPTISTNNRDR